MSNNREIILLEEELEKLKCAKCRNYLSCGPVFLKHTDGEAICGRCTKPEIELVTEYHRYEALAKHFLFPCIYSENGCLEKIKFSKEKPNPHDMSCFYRPFMCYMSFIKQCDWIGNFEQQLKHWEEKHPSQVLSKPFTYNCSTSVYQIKELDALFYIFVRVHPDKIVHTSIGNVMKKIEYILKIKRGEDEITKCREHNINSTPNGNAWPLLSNSLTNILGGTDNIKFEIELKNISSPNNKHKKRKHIPP